MQTIDTSRVPRPGCRPHPPLALAGLAPAVLGAGLPKPARCA